jgi:hypothetical protein
MPAITDDNKDFWQKLANDLAADRPFAGKTVEVVKGRKHKGKVGIVRRHQLDKFSTAYRYGNDASHHMKDMAGTYGWCCMIQDNATGENFWVRADYLKVIQPIPYNE